MTRLPPTLAIVGLGLLCGACAGGQSSSPNPAVTPSSAETATYKCESCGKTVTVAAGAAAPSC